MVVANDTEFMFTVDQETNPLPLTAIVAGRAAEFTIVGNTELSCGSGVAPVHSMLPQLVNHDTATMVATTTLKRAIWDIAYLPSVATS